MKKLTQLNRFMVILCAVLTMSFTSVWAVTSPYVATPSGTISAKGGEITLSDVTWTYGSASYLAISSSMIQIGSKNNPQTSGWTISTPISSFGSGVTITKVQINAKTGGAGSYDISVGGDSKQSGSLSTTATDYQTPTLAVTSGNIAITITGDTKAAYLGTITVTFTSGGGGGDEPSLSVSPSSIKFDKVEVGTTSVEGKTVTVTIENVAEVLAYMEKSADSPFSIDKESLTESGTITITPLASTLAAVGEYTDTLTITDAEELTKKVPVSINVTDPAVIEKGFKLVTDASVLKAGDELILGAAITSGETTNYFAAGAFGTNKFFSSTSATVAGDEISAPEAIIIKLGGNAGAWTFTTSEGLIGTKAAKALVLDDKDATTTWTISIDESNNAIITSTGEGFGSIQYNSGSPRFLNYATTQKPIQLYCRAKKQTAPTPVTEITAVNALDTIAVSDKLSLRYTITPDTATDQRVEFAIVNGGEFISLKDGVVTGIAEGDAQVSVTALDSLNKSAKLSATYNIHVKEGVFNTCAEANAAKSGDKLNLNKVTTVYVNGAYVYVKDESGSTLVFLYENGLNAGDVIMGIKGTASPYSGLPELKPSNKVSDWTITPGDAPEIPAATAAPTAAEVNQVLEWKGVTGMSGAFSSSATNITGKLGTEDIIFRNNFKLAYTFDEQKTYDITGAVAIYTKDQTTTIQVYFISAKESSGTGLETMKAATAVKKMMVNGQMVIMRDGKMFNALGAEL